jgi:hypothetical protein
MSERVISDPTVAGWELNPDTGYWMWAAASGGGGGGSIQDGDTEGQITTWSGDEWTPDGAVVVDDNGNVAIGTDTPLYTSADRTALTVNGTSSANLVFGHSDVAKHYLLSDASGLTVGTDGNANLVIDADGSVNITGKLFINGEEVTAGGGGGGLWTDNNDGSISYSGTVRATDVVATG